MHDFYRHPQMADGHLNKCKDCAKADVRLHRSRNLARVRAYDRKRSMLPHRVEARRSYDKTSAGRAAHRRASTKWNHKRRGSPTYATPRWRNYLR